MLHRKLLNALHERRKATTQHRLDLRGVRRDEPERSAPGAVREELGVVHERLDVLHVQELAVVQERAVPETHTHLHPHHEPVLPAARERLQLRLQAGFQREKAEKTVVDVRGDRFVVAATRCADQTAVHERLVVEVVLGERAEDRTVGIHLDVAIAEFLVDVPVEKTLCLDTSAPDLQRGAFRGTH